MSKSETEKTKTPKMNYEEFFEVVVGKTAAITKEIQKKTDDLTEYLLDELEKYAVDNNLPIPQWILDKVQKTNEKTSAAKVPIEFEEVTIKVPKPIMEFLRKTDGDNEGAAAWIESQIIGDVRARLEDVTLDELADWFKLGPTLSVG